MTLPASRRLGGIVASRTSIIRVAFSSTTPWATMFPYWPSATRAGCRRPGWRTGSASARDSFDCRACTCALAPLIADRDDRWRNCTRQRESRLERAQVEGRVRPAPGTASLHHGRRCGRRPGHEHVERARRDLRRAGGGVGDVADRHVRAQGRGRRGERRLERLRPGAEAHPQRGGLAARAATRPRCRPRRGPSSRSCRPRRRASAGACAPRGGRRGRSSAGGASRPGPGAARSRRRLPDGAPEELAEGRARRARTRAPAPWPAPPGAAPGRRRPGRARTAAASRRPAAGARPGTPGSQSPGAARDVDPAPLAAAGAELAHRAAGHHPARGR